MAGVLRRRARAALRGQAPELLVLDLALELRERPAQVPADRRRGDLLGQPAEDPRAGHAVLEAELDAGAVGGPLAQPPARALVDAGDRVPRDVGELVPLDDLDAAADLRRADVHQRAVPRADAGRLVADDLEARHAGHEVQVARGVGDELPDELARRGDLDADRDPHPTRGSWRSAAKASRAACMRDTTLS